MGTMASGPRRRAVPVVLGLAAREKVRQPTSVPGNSARLIGDMQFFARRYDSGQVIRLEIGGQQITAVEPARAEVPSSLSCPWISPGWWDIQVNGYAGQEFSSTSLRAEKVVEVGRAMLEFGATRFCPTVTTQCDDTLAHALRTIAAACGPTPSLARQVPGVHRRGHTSPARWTAATHPRPLPAARREPLLSVAEAAGEQVRLVTISPEYDEAARIHRAGDRFRRRRLDRPHRRRLNPNPPRVDAHGAPSQHSPRQWIAPVIRRHPNYIWDQLADDRLMASLIADGHHLPAAVLKTFIQAEVAGLRRILVSDLSGQAGQPPGRCHQRVLRG